MKKKCKHRFDYHQVIDLNVDAADIKCQHCKKSYVLLAKTERTLWDRIFNRHASFKHIPGPTGIFDPSGALGHFTIQFTKGRKI